MTIVYFDASALVELVVEESGTPLVIELWDECDAAVSSRLSYPEVRAALATAVRDHRIAARDVAGAERDWELYWAGIRQVELSDAVAGEAGELCCTHALSGANGVHLASALAVARAGTDLVMAAWDQRLAVAALAVGLRVAPKPRRR